MSFTAKFKVKSGLHYNPFFGKPICFYILGLFDLLWLFYSSFLFSVFWLDICELRIVIMILALQNRIKFHYFLNAVEPNHALTFHPKQIGLLHWI